MNLSRLFLLAIILLPASVFADEFNGGDEFPPFFTTERFFFELNAYCSEYATLPDGTPTGSCAVYTPAQEFQATYRNANGNSQSGTARFCLKFFGVEAFGSTTGSSPEPDAFNHWYCRGEINGEGVRGDFFAKHHSCADILGLSSNDSHLARYIGGGRCALSEFDTCPDGSTLEENQGLCPECPEGTMFSAETNSCDTFTSSVEDQAPTCTGDSTGKPCNPATGNKTKVQVDYRSPNPYSPSLIRTYNSLGETTTAPGLSAGWNHNHANNLNRQALSLIHI